MTSRMAAWQADMDKTSETTTASRKRLLELVQSDDDKALVARHRRGARGLPQHRAPRC